jgi:phosphate starvation-inducible PhoH-like protein
LTYPPDTDSRVRVPSNHLMVELLGNRDVHLKRVEDAFPGARLIARGNEIDIAGDERQVSLAHTVLEELLVLVQEGQSLDADRVDRVIAMVKADIPKPSGVFTDHITVGRGKVVRAKTHGQKGYVDAIRENTLVFGIGPAGTGKTYLAMACAVEALVTGADRRGEGRPLPATPLRRPLRDARPGGDEPPYGAGDDRDRPPRLHARQDAQRCLRGPR